MPRDVMSPHKNLRRSTRDHARLYSSLQENQLGMGDVDFDEPIRYSTRSRELRESRRNSGYTRSGRKINTKYYDQYDGFSSEDNEPSRRRKLTYRQEVMMAITESKRAQKERERVSPVPKRKRIFIEEEEDDPLQPENQEPEEIVLTTRKNSKKQQTQDVRSSKEPEESCSNRYENEINSEKDESPIRRSRRKVQRISSGEHGEDEEEEKKEVDEDEVIKKKKLEENDEEIEKEKDEDVKDELLEREEEEDEEEDKEPEIESSSSSSEEEEMPRQYSLRQRRPAAVSFRQEQAAQMRNRQIRETGGGGGDRRRGNGGGNRHHRGRSNRMRSDTDSSDNERRFDRKDRKHHLDRSRFMPINMTEKDIASIPHAIQERLRKTAGGQGSSDIDPMAIDTNVGFDQVGGLSHHIQSLKEVVLFPMLYPDLFKKFDVNPPKGVVFYGPPGTGKTLVARALANECRKGANKVAFFMRKGADCLSKWVGESERQLRLLFDQAYSMRPSIIFFDEIDGLAPVRSSKQDQIHASIVSTLLALMDGLDCRGEVVVIGATNRLDTLDPALRRPGRFDRELRFSLPDLNARRQILEIHTSKWEENKPSAETLNIIAEKTSGYCGADLKYLCTESVLIALRCRYPHIYMSSERLQLDLATIRVEKEHFEHAMRRITPASRRDLTIPSRPLDERTRILLGETVENLISIRIPQGYRYVENAASVGSTELEKVIRALEPNPTVPAIRLLICGSMAIADGGQTSYVLPAILAKLDHLPVFSLSVSSLLTDGRPEESFSNAIQGAMRASTSGPCIILLPSIDEWIKVVPVSVQHMLITCLESMTGFTPILFLATLDSSFEDAPDYAREIFRHANCISMPPARRILREKYFEHITEPIYEKPKMFDASKYIQPQIETAATLALASTSNNPTRRLNEAEARELEKLYMSLLRQMRIFLRDRLNRLIRDRRFVDFVMPVDVEDAEDYYEIIEKPMCLMDMMEKLDNKTYIHADQFLDDVRLITANALEYNPANTQDGRTIRHMAIGLRDVAEELFDSELDENFVEHLETASRLLQEAGIVPEDEKLIEIPNGFVRKGPWSLKNSLKLEIEHWKKEREKESKQNGILIGEEKKVDEASGAATAESGESIITSRATSVRRRSKSYNFPGLKRKKTNKVSNSEEKSDENAEEEKTNTEGEETGEETAIEDEEMNEESIGTEKLAENGEEPKEKEESFELKNEEKVGELKISKEEVNELIGFCIEKTEGWSVSELERLASVMSHKIEQYRNKWNRTDLPSELMTIAKNWQPLIQEDVDESIDSPLKTSSSMTNGIH